MRLADIRKRNNLTQEEVGKRFGVGQNAVSQWESGKSYPTPDKIIKLATLYHTTADEIIQAIREAKWETA